MDLFWLHRTLDRLDPGDSKLVAAGLLAFFMLTTVVAEWREYRAPAHLREVLYGDDEDPLPASDPPG